MGEMEVEDVKTKCDDSQIQNQQKKLRKFSAKELRTQLQGINKLNALQNFLHQINENDSQDCALEYLQKNGNIHEILQCMEQDLTLPPVLVLEIVNALLLKIIRSKLDLRNATYESCRYLLNDFISVINKMIGLSSSSKERIVVLKLLTSMATFSSNLSKDILMHVNFNLTHVELLSKNTLQNKTVRKHFIYFLTAVLIDIEYPTLSVLLEKKGMLTSIIPGLIYDDVDTVCFMVTAMKNSILENQFVSKTMKMKTFNTIVIKNIVNLYNWKGPSNLKAFEVKKGPVQVNEIEKAKVSECVHDFLLILCTSHKYGVIFRDPLVGLGKKIQNALVYTVLDSMDLPWDHSYASDLVIKICYACPDLTKHVWTTMKTSIEPRHSTKWMKVVQFVQKLLEELNPKCLEPYIQQLSFYQISQLITILIAPLPILKILIPENNTYEFQIIRQHVMLIISSILKSIQSYVEASEKWLNKEQYTKLKNHLADYVERNFPSGQSLLVNWDKLDPAEIPQEFNPLEYLTQVFDIFEYYLKICPELLDSLRFSHQDLKQLLEGINSLSSEENDSRNLLQVKIIDTFLQINPSIFALSSNSFDFFFSFLLRTSYDNIKRDESRYLTVLNKLIINTKIFDYGSEKEIDVWINGIFNLKSFNENLSVFLSAAFKMADLKMLEYLKQISCVDKLLENDGSYVLPDQVHLSPMIMSVLECLKTNDIDKSVTSYLNFVIPHLIFLKLDSTVVLKLLNECKELKSSVVDYINSIDSEDVSFEIPKIIRVFGKNDIHNEFNTALSEDNFKDIWTQRKDDISLYPHLKFDLLQMGIFYFSKLLRLNHPKQFIYGKNLLCYIDSLLDEPLFTPSIVLNQISFLQQFSILDVNENGEYNCATKFIIDFIKNITTKKVISEKELKFYNEKVLSMVFTILKNPKKFNDIKISSVLEMFQMNSETYFDILNQISDLISEKPTKIKYKVFYSILAHCLLQYCENQSGCMKFSKKIFKNLLTFYTLINEESETSLCDLSNAFMSCFSAFPKTVDVVDSNFVNSILRLKDYQKINAELIVFILKRRFDLVHCVKHNLDNLMVVKGMLYPVLQTLSEQYLSDSNSEKQELENIFHEIFDKFQETLHKNLKKPQKASQHLDTYHLGVSLMIKLNFTKENFEFYVSKVHKFEVTKIFHVNLLYTIFKKFTGLELNSSVVNNVILTFSNLLSNILKRIPKKETDTSEIIDNTIVCFINYLDDVSSCNGTFDFKAVQNSESFKLMIKFCLKYGVSEHEKLISLVEKLIVLIGENFEQDQIESVVEMLVSHSEFLDVVLSENHKCKLGILSLMLVVCDRWPQVMKRSHVPILLSSYGATLTKCDETNLKLLKKYESARHQTSFYDFKPYLWGSTGANHYSVRSDIEKALFKQPKMIDVLNILQDNVVVSTIKNYHLYKNSTKLDSFKENQIYDLEFLLPLFSHLLAPENVVKTYHFTRSGALSLTIIGLSSEKESVRRAACHVLARFYFHVEARQTGKDNLLWIRLIEVICGGVHSDENLILNNFASVFLARTALILTQPNHVMFLPLSQYLAAKPTLDFSSIPELYTLLHSCDVNYKEHRSFIFEILSDGLITDNDYKIFFKSMAYKLFTELYSSCTCDNDSKLLILDVLISLCRLKIGVKYLCTHNSLLEYLSMDVSDNIETASSNKSNIAIIIKLVHIFQRVLFNLDESNNWGKFLISNACQKIVKCDTFSYLPESTCKILKEINKG